LLAPTADSYRILGSNREVSFAELRRHMALIMRWLHPDLVSDNTLGNDLNRSLYTKRVTRAWEFIKAQGHPERIDGSEARRAVPAAEIANSPNSKPVHRAKRLAVSRLEPNDFLSRLLRMIGGRR
jgi:hypothetical protein